MAMDDTTRKINILQPLSTLIAAIGPLLSQLYVEQLSKSIDRKGRLIVEHKFGKLSAEESNKLLKHLEKNQVVDEGMVLADIYNIDTEVYKTSTKGNKIGF